MSSTPIRSLPKLDYKSALLPALVLDFVGEDLGLHAEDPIRELCALIRPDEVAPARVVDLSPSERRLKPPAGGSEQFVDARFVFEDEEAACLLQLRISAVLGLSDLAQANWVLAQMQALQTAADCGPGGILVTNDPQDGSAPTYAVHPRAHSAVGGSVVSHMSIAVQLDQLHARLSELEAGARCAGWLMNATNDAGAEEILDWMTGASQDAHEVAFLSAAMSTGEPAAVACAVRHWGASKARLTSMPAWASSGGRHFTRLINEQGTHVLVRGADWMAMPVSSWQPAPDKMADRWAAGLRDQRGTSNDAAVERPRS